MNIAFLWHRPIDEFAGGVGVVTKILAREMQRRGHRVILLAFITPEKKRHYAKFLETLGMSQDTYPYVAPQYYVDAALPMAEMTAQASRILDDNEIQMVLQQDMDPLGMQLLGNLPDKYIKVVNKHSQPFEAYKFTRKVHRRYKPQDWPRRLWRMAVLACPALGRWRTRRVSEPMYWQAVRSADRLCLLSSGFVTRLLHFMPGLDRSKLCFVNNPNTYEIKESTAYRKENLVVMVCRLEDSCKNVSDFMRAWKLVERSHPDWKAEIVGGGDDLEMLRRKSRRMGLTALSFEGYKSDVADYYERAKILCVCSWYEGWSMNITEGMSRSCVPIVYNTYEAVSDIFDDGESGLVVKSCQPRELYDKLDDLMRHSERMQELAGHAVERVRQFSADKIVEKWEQLYQEIKEEKYE